MLDFDLILTCITYVLFFSYAFAMALPIFILTLLPSSWPWAQAIFFFLCKVTGKLLLLFTFLPVIYQGLERIPQKPVIFVANHQSSLDIPLITSIMSSRYCWIAKEELFHYPLLGNLLSYFAIPVYEKTNPCYGTKSVVAASVEWLAKGYNVMIFPEGGRYGDGVIHPFFSGFAAMAKLSGVLVVPLFISGADKAMPAGKRLIHRAHLMVTVGEPFECGPDESVEAFKQRVYDWYEELNWRKKLLEEDYGICIAKKDNRKELVVS